ncbi:MAG: CsbD family protein [Terracidiphilus sp.]|jgi:uncharacterized protein YjbJ (UPF0337 family)
MDKDRVKGAIDEAVGSAKRHLGGWTGDINTQAEGMAQQAKGKVETAFGKLKDAGRDALDSTTAPHEVEGGRREVIFVEDQKIP